MNLGVLIQNYKLKIHVDMLYNENILPREDSLCVFWGFSEEFLFYTVLGSDVDNNHKN